MRKHFLHASVLLSLLTCCTPNNREQAPQNNTVTDTVSVVNDPKSNLNVQTSQFFEIDSSGILMFPLTMAETEGKDRSFSYENKWNGSAYWNIVFLNGKTNEYHLLSEKKMIIQSYDFNYGSRSDDNVNMALNKKHIFYGIITDDFNQDGKLTVNDPKYLFITNKTGRNLRQISPANFDLQNWQYVKSVDKVLMTVKKDSDKNRKFDDTDEVATFEITIDKDSLPKEVFSEAFKNKLKLLYNRDWRKPKE
jgi:hypothetical protein